MAPTTVSVPRLSERRALLEEQRRLAKLWDAFKKQEDEYRAVEKERDELWQQIKGIEEDKSFVGDMAAARAKITRYESENEKMRADVAGLGARVEATTQQFFAEQERLAKLFKVYQDTEARLGDAWKEINAWRAWWTKFGPGVPKKAGAAAKKVPRAR